LNRATTFLLDAATRMGVLEIALKLKPSRPLILMYHGVSSRPMRNGLQNYDGKHIALDVFVQHLRIVRRSRRVISLGELVHGLDNRQDMRNTVAITFDDGYENNVLVAAPALSDFNMTASFFLTTGLIGTERCIWTDQLEIALMRTHHTISQLPENAGELPIRSLAEKRQALFRIKAMLKALSTQNVNEAVETLTNELGVEDICAEGDYRFMHWQQARDLVGAGFEVGAHTVSHPILTNIRFEAAAAEILGSRDKVQQETGTCSSTFCFPNGKLSDFNAELKGLCQKHFKAALSSERGAAVVEDIFELKRLSPSGPGKGENLEWLLLRTE
jgi:peptidoglycan/xylan/chitin deacetylase (PgdA/CDA1 family)